MELTSTMLVMPFAMLWLYTQLAAAYLSGVSVLRACRWIWKLTNDIYCCRLHSVSCFWRHANAKNIGFALCQLCVRSTLCQIHFHWDLGTFSTTPLTFYFALYGARFHYVLVTRRGQDIPCGNNKVVYIQYKEKGHHNACWCISPSIANTGEGS